MKTLPILMISLLSLLSLLASCGTMFNGGPDSIPISSKPAGATVSLDGIQVGVTPCTIVVKRTAKGIVRVDLKGYISQQRRLPTATNGSTALNILLGYAAPIGILMDAASGNVSTWDSPPMFILKNGSGLEIIDKQPKTDNEDEDDDWDYE